MRILNKLDPQVRRSAAIVLAILGVILPMFLAGAPAEPYAARNAVGLFLLVAVCTWGPALWLVWDLGVGGSTLPAPQRPSKAPAAPARANDLQRGMADDGSVMNNYAPSNRRERRAAEKATRREEGQKRAAAQRAQNKR